MSTILARSGGRALSETVIKAIAQSRTLSRGRYEFSILANGEVLASGRCHVFVGDGQVVLADPASQDATALTVADIEGVDQLNRSFRSPELVVKMSSGAELRLVDKASPRDAFPMTRALQELTDLHVLHGLRQFTTLTKLVRNELELSRRREEAAEAGTILPEDLAKVLGETVIAYDYCVYMGSARDPHYAPEGPAFQGVCLAGETKCGFINYDHPGVCWTEFGYADVALLGYRPVRVDEHPLWFVEVLVVPQPRGERLHPHERPKHHCARLPEPTGSLEEPNVTDVVLARVRASSRWDLEGRVGTESEVEGLVLLPVTPE